jgi:hypothetical protein
VPVWTGTENFAPTGIRPPDRRACSESQYPLRHPGQFCNNLCIPPVENKLQFYRHIWLKVFDILKSPTIPGVVDFWKRPKRHLKPNVMNDGGSFSFQEQVLFPKTA